MLPTAYVSVVSKWIILSIKFTLQSVLECGRVDQQSARSKTGKSINWSVEKEP